METTKIRWSFEGLPSVFETEASKLDATVHQLRQRNFLTYDHPITILSDGTTNPTIEPAADNIPVSNSNGNTKKRKSVSKPVENTESLSTPTIVRPLFSDVDESNTESDAL